MRRPVSSMSDEEFEAIVAEVWDSLPPDLKEHLETEANLAIVVQDWPTRAQLRSAGLDPRRETLFGLYEGVANTKRTTHYGLVPPDKITIFRGPILSYYDDPDIIREEIRRVVLHEIAHYFGYDEEGTADLGL